MRERIAVFLCEFFFLPRRKSLLSVRTWTRTQAAVSQDCLLGECVLCTQADKRKLIHGVLINGMCLFADGTRAARRREYERRAFVAHKLLLLQPQQVAVVRLGSLCSSSHTAKNFAFIFDIQAQVRLFLPCGSPCVRSTSDCAVLLRSWRTKDGGIISELSLFMRVLTVSPTNDR